MEGWFIKTTNFKNEIINNNNNIEWFPSHIKEGRMGNFLENMVDWNIGRNRYWGTPLNVWICNDCNHEYAPSSIKDLQNNSINKIDEDIELHRPYVDNITLSCPKCNGKMSRVEEVIDVWFDSGSMPFAQHHYPFDNQKIFNQHFPADFIAEGVDQTRGWFYSLLVISTILKGKSSYKRALSLGHILDSNGKKMSKSKGNVINPDDIVSSHGADTLRLYEMFMGPLDAAIAWSENGLDGSRRFLDRVWRLIVTEDGSLNNKIVESNDKLLDKVYNQTVKKVTEDFDALSFNTAISQLMVFINDCYKANEIYKPYIEGFVKMLAPIAPHICEELWSKLGHNETITYQPWPTFDESLLVDDEVEIVVQVNGKVRAKLNIPKDLSKEEMQDLALANDNVKMSIEGKEIKKIIAVPQKLVNIVAK